MHGQCVCVTTVRLSGFFSSEGNGFSLLAAFFFVGHERYVSLRVSFFRYVGMMCVPRNE